MSVADLRQTTESLRLALKDATLPREFQLAGRHLLAHLTNPTQIAVLGFSGSGKTSLLNLLLRDVAMPDLDGVPIVELIHGKRARVTCEPLTAAPEQRDGLAAQGCIPPRTFRVVQELPLPQLKGRRLIEINIPDEFGQQADLLEWAAQRAHVAIWCSEEFDDREAKLWSSVPDRLKDHSFLALTKADRLQMKGLLGDQVSRFEDQFADEFVCLYPVATKQGIAACTSGTITRADLWQACGGKALSDGLDREIANGKLADRDHADVLLTRIGFSAPPRETVSDATEIVEPEVIPESEKSEPAQVARHGDPVLAQMGRDEAIEMALSLLQGCANEMLAGGSDQKTAPPEFILDNCAQTAQALATLLMDTQPDDPEIGMLREDALESEQLILLLKLERNHCAASDAIAVLLQLKKEMSLLGAA